MNVGVAVAGLSASPGKVYVNLTACTSEGATVGLTVEVDFATTTAQRAARFVAEATAALAARGVAIGAGDSVKFFGVAG